MDERSFDWCTNLEEHRYKRVNVLFMSNFPSYWVFELAINGLN